MPCDVVVVEIYVSSFQLDGDEDRPFLLNLSSLLAVWTEGVVVDDPSFQRERERESPLHQPCPAGENRSSLGRTMPRSYLAGMGVSVQRERDDVRF